MDTFSSIYPKYFTKDVPINFTCTNCGYTVNNIPERFFGRRVKCHCQTIQHIPTKPIEPKKQVWKTVNILSVGASIILLAVIASLFFRYGGELIEKSDPFQRIFDVVLPVFGIMLAGYFTGVFGIMGDAATEALNRYCFFIALPAVFVASMSQVPFGDLINLPLLAAFSGGIAITMVITLVLGRILFNDRFGVNALRATSSIHANVGYMGIPLFMLLFGETGLLPAIVATVVVGVGVTGLATALLELSQGHNGKEGNLNLNVLTGVLKSPLLLSAAVGLALSGFGIELPKVASTFCKTLGQSAGPCALFAIGLFMAGKPISSGSLEVFWLTGMKLVIHPLITAWLAFKVLPLDPRLASAIVILSALPTGSLVFVLAHKYKLYVHRVTSVILISTMMSLVTLSLLFVVLGLA